MKPWFSLTIVCWALLCLLLGLSQQAGLNHPLQVANSGPWLDRCSEVASGSPTAAVLRSVEFDPVRAGPLAPIGPRGQETHGPPELGKLPSQSRQLKTTSSQRAPTKSTGLTDRI
jgi:hypothetical protein